jgi:hypothetical protein
MLRGSIARGTYRPVARNLLLGGANLTPGGQASGSRRKFFFDDLFSALPQVQLGQTWTAGGAKPPGYGPGYV